MDGPAVRPYPVHQVGLDRRASLPAHVLHIFYTCKDCVLMFNSCMFYPRKQLPHHIPVWVPDGAAYFITICTQPKGFNQLCQPKAWRLIKHSLQFRQERADLWVHLLLLMPDHLHAIMSFSPMVGMAKSINEWKRYTCVQGDINWQRDFFDHRLRRNESYFEKAHYIRMNPVRAGLCQTPEEWPYVWENK